MIKYTVNQISKQFVHFIRSRLKQQTMVFSPLTQTMCTHFTIACKERINVVFSAKLGLKRRYCCFGPNF